MSNLALSGLATPPRRKWATPGRLGVVGVSTAVHLALFVFIASQVEPGQMVDSGPIEVSLFDGALLSPAPAPPAPEVAPPTETPPEKPKPVEPTPKKPVPVRAIARPTPAPARVATLAAAAEPAEEQAPVAEPSGAQLAGAITADAGAPGGGCDMTRWLQGALRKNAKVQAAVAYVHRSGGSPGKAIWVWNGDWVRSPGEEGHGLAGVREAIMLEIAFAPEACRTTEPMNRLVVLSLSDSPGSSRLAVGAGQWRWADLLKSPRRLG